MKTFIDIMRAPDVAYGATQASNFRWEEEKLPCPVRFEYQIQNGFARVIVYPSDSPVKYLKLRWRGDFSFVDKVYGDQWERAGTNAVLEWRSVNGSRVLPWFCYLIGDNKTACYGVKTGANCFAFWQVDTHGITLFLNLTNGWNGVQLEKPLLACEVVQTEGEIGQDCYDVATQFSKKLCDSPILPKEPIFGVNNWYWAYGNISKEVVLQETDYLLRMTGKTKHRPYMIIDDGWQKNRTYGDNAYIGGEWTPNERFGDMRALVDKIHEKGAKVGLWFRPLLTREDVPQDAVLCEESGGKILDPSHPYTIEKVMEDVQRIKSWGVDLIKHDFTTIDITGIQPLTSEQNSAHFIDGKRNFYDKTRTLATIIKDLYYAIQTSAGEIDVIGCNTIGHLTAGIHSVYRVGNDTSGQNFEWTKRHGVNSIMRLPQNNAFYNVDPDCAAFTDMVNAEINLDYLELCAITGMTTLASVTPHILNEHELNRIRKIFQLADKNQGDYVIKNYDKNSIPDTYINTSGKIKKYDWDKIYDGSRTVLMWAK